MSLNILYRNEAPLNMRIRADSDEETIGWTAARTVWRAGREVFLAYHMDKATGISVFVYNSEDRMPGTASSSCHKAALACVPDLS